MLGVRPWNPAVRVRNSTSGGVRWGPAGFARRNLKMLNGEATGEPAATDQRG
jgi:hypothetical protein